MNATEYKDFVLFWIDIHQPKTIIEYISCLENCPSKEMIDETKLPF